MAFILFIVITAAGVWFLKKQEVNDPKYQFLKNYARKGAESNEAFNISHISKTSFFEKVKLNLDIALSVVGRHRYIKISLFLLLVISLSLFVNNRWLGFGSVWFTTIVTASLSIISIRWLIAKREKNFNETFPDALNIMMSAVTAGESLTHAFAYVGKTLDTEIGHEFQDMADRMNLGESSELIFKRSSSNFPYPAYLFFLVTIQANITKGGQLKAVFRRLTRILAEARTLEKKKLAMTSEARISAKIVAAIPFIFMFLMQFFAKDNLDFVLFNPDGKWILYYVIGSEGLGLFIIWYLVKGIR